jgi:phospholipid/cholesterol/gamma-HCH transport system substrate-binding protein
MPQRKSLALAELRVGLLVIASFLLLALAIFVIGGQSGLLESKYTITALFPTANGLRNGAEVWLEGVTIGNVSSVAINNSPDPDESVAVEMRLVQRYQDSIRSDSIVAINTQGLLGDKIVDISRGTTAGSVIPDGGTIQGTDAGDIREIITGTNDFIANLDILSDQIVRMAERVDRGEGTLGKFLIDSSIYDNANSTVREATLLVKDARSGDGTIGKLISNDELHSKIMQISDRIDTLISKIESGDGTAGRLVNDPAVYNKTNELLGKVTTVVDRIERGEGTMGKLMRDEMLYTDAREMVNRVSTLVSAIENGEGTAGRLIKDPTLYNSMNQFTSEILKLLYDFRQDPRRFLTINFRLF